MKARIISVGTKMPNWVNEGCQTYLKRLASPASLELKEVSLLKRSGNNADAQIDKEGEKMLALIPKQSCVVSLNVKGTPYSSEQLAHFLKEQQMQYPSFTFLIGGPEGLARACLQKSHFHWSLSPLTLPHPIARLMVCEALYRAYSIQKGMPYHK